MFPNPFLCKHTKSSWVDAEREERQYLQLRVRIWKMMDKWIGFKGLKLLSGERGSEEKKTVVFQAQSLEIKRTCSPLKGTVLQSCWRRT